MGLLADQDREQDQTNADSLLPLGMTLPLGMARRCSRVTGNAGTGSAFYSGWSEHMQGDKHAFRTAASSPFAQRWCGLR
jgi:hypothetical protein